ncbi:RNA methyltransferase [Seongchinamella sediminis]|uniref:RNA methyltransferase n=1 Tax=Seongchinamella sediminis TaxID=2283635 RepID=A0A3L7DZ99_9GAMM|nr:RNA methyltransferase [Seongchinamella sediminis]RLQ22928.1 RNA methyltransferase [Seongchinamella sediminis]
MTRQDSSSYRAKKAFYERVLTVYGRKPVLEALRDPRLQCHTLHLASSNRSGGIIAELTAAAGARDIPVREHSREALSRISRNGRQDQGVALDILCPAFRSLQTYLDELPGLPRQRVLALDGISNPQNLGMILRSASAGSIDAVLWSRRGNAALGPLVIKASAGTLYRAPLVLCDSQVEALRELSGRGFEICSLEASARQTLFAHRPRGHAAFVLGNETEGVSAEVAALADCALSIPMNNGVESLNVAVTASLIAYADTIG